MKPYKFILAILILAGLAIGCYLEFFRHTVQKSGANLVTICDAFKQGDSFDESKERKRLEALGISFNKISYGSAPEYQVNLLTSGMEPSICELRIKSGKILSVK